MKKILYIAAACATLASCDISNIEKVTPADEGNAFVKGQKVTLTVSAGADTKATGSLNTTTNGIDFKWESGDRILVTVEGEGSAPFTLKGDGGSSTGVFEGEMPGSGSTFNAQYPAVDPSLASQTYYPDHAIARGLMKSSATGCTVGTPFTLTPEYAVLRLNLWGSKTIGKIVVTDLSSGVDSKPCFTLSCADGVVPGSTEDTATPFFIVIPAGERNIQCDVFDNSSNPSVISSYWTSDALSFNACHVLNMAPQKEQIYPGSDESPVTIDGVTWAPVNCGTDAIHPYGLLYEYGRKNGQGFYDATISPLETDPVLAATYSGENGTEDPNTFYLYREWGITYVADWIISGSNLFWDSSGNSTSTGQVTPTKTVFDPCPTGWRLPTFYEFNGLIQNNSGFLSGTLAVKGQNGVYCYGSLTSAETKVFFPAAGVIGGRIGDKYPRGTYARYWTSSVIKDTYYARVMYFDANSPAMSKSNRAQGNSIRCVQE